MWRAQGVPRAGVAVVTRGSVGTEALTASDKHACRRLNPVEACGIYCQQLGTGLLDTSLAQVRRDTCMRKSAGMRTAYGWQDSGSVWVDGVWWCRTGMRRLLPFWASLLARYGSPEPCDVDDILTVYCESIGMCTAIIACQNHEC